MRCGDSAQVLIMFDSSYVYPRPFVWYPLQGQRHAINQQDRNVSLGEPMRCLCGAIHPRGASGDTEWLWPTCQECWDQACIIVGLRPHP
jgi:hypothetical protein